MMTWKKFWKYFSNLLLILIILILFIPSWRVSFQGWYQGWFMDDIVLEKSEKEPVDESVKKWILFDMNSQLFSFEEFKNKPVILNFWATWCSYCRPEIAEISELQEFFGNRINYLSVTEEPIEIVENSGLHDDYNFLYFTQEIPSFFKVNSYPSLFILNSDLEIVYRHKGAGKINTDKNIKFLEELIENK